MDATRPINDLDLEVSTTTIDSLAPLVVEFITFGPGRYRDSTWDLYLMTLCYEGQEIDISTSEY